MWIKNPEIHSRKLERLLKLPYTWTSTWKKITAGVFTSSLDTEAGVENVISEDAVSRLMWRRVESVYRMKEMLFSGVLSGFINAIPVAQGVYWHSRQRMPLESMVYVYFGIHLILSTYMMASFFLYLNMGRLQYNMALHRLRLFDTLTIPTLVDLYGLPFLNLKFPANRLAWWRMREQVGWVQGD